MSKYVSEYEVWTYEIEVYYEHDEYVTFPFYYDLGADGSGGITPEDLHDEVISEVENALRIVPRFVRSSHE